MIANNYYIINKTNNHLLSGAVWIGVLLMIKLFVSFFFKATITKWFKTPLKFRDFFSQCSWLKRTLIWDYKNILLKIRKIINKNIMLPVTKSADKILQGKFMGLSKVWKKPILAPRKKLAPSWKLNDLSLRCKVNAYKNSDI
jgi:hypothetical protein